MKSISPLIQRGNKKKHSKQTFVLDFPTYPEIHMIKWYEVFCQLLVKPCHNAELVQNVMTYMHIQFDTICWHNSVVICLIFTGPFHLCLLSQLGPNILALMEYSIKVFPFLHSTIWPTQHLTLFFIFIFIIFIQITSNIPCDIIQVSTAL